MYFSICIPTYNRKHTLFRTLDSIRTQNFKSYEVLIVDDGSDDGTGEAVDSYINKYNVGDRFKYFYKENGGKHSALNLGIEKAEGKFFIIFDSDDWFVENALECMYNYCKNIENDERFSGIMGRSMNATTNSMVGDLFDEKYKISSYFEYHFILPLRMNIGDCLEANKTDILKKYRFPEPANTKFVNEAWLFDQIGVKYKLYVTNDIFRYVEYQQDGISSDSEGYKKKNIVGYLYHYISRIENVIPNAPVKGMLKLKINVLAWWRYWDAVNIDKDAKGPRIDNISFFGKGVKIFMPILNYIFYKIVKIQNK